MIPTPTFLLFAHYELTASSFGFISFRFFCALPAIYPTDDDFWSSRPNLPPDRDQPLLASLYAPTCVTDDSIYRRMGQPEIDMPTKISIAPRR